MRCVLLAVYHFYCMTSQVADERGERDFRRIRDLGEHRFAEEHPPERHAVQPADALAVAPGFDAVRFARTMQRRIGFDDIGWYISAAAGLSGRRRDGAA